MRYVAAYLLAVIGGKNNPTVDDVKKILGSVGIDADVAKAELLVKELTGKSIEEVIKKGSEKLASVPSGGVAASAAATPAAGGGGGSPKKEDKKEEKKKEEEEEEDDDMGFGLFD